MTHCIKRGVKDEVDQIQRKQIDIQKVCSECLPLVRTQTGKQLAIGQLRQQLATAPSRAAHADAVAA